MANQVQPDGRRVFDDVYSFPSDSQDLADDLYEAYNVRVGTSAERQSLPVAQQKPSMLWVETDGEHRLMRTDGAGGWTDYFGTVKIPLTTFSSAWAATPGYVPYLVAEGKKRTIFGAASRSSGGTRDSIMIIPEPHRPPSNCFIGGATTSSGIAYTLGVQANGIVWIPYGGVDSTAAVHPLVGSWTVA